ncbi:YczE/YyaS/YitT family protein [Streptococcus cuniculi]|uniref:Uncharacterized protein n=1 Tax=Streptococcus cuniculi TaxID=1432788 RepID=A0A4Y9JB03_9STRE|nr:hypothetical protein [Streptococcus cuniculi]MBF0778774.1 hypothetical protein [Streptococcus cuniculi]TFU97276.1 hypothetical protein E4T82_08590 [Streptococcus cuniculi]
MLEQKQERLYQEFQLLQTEAKRLDSRVKEIQLDQASWQEVSEVMASNRQLIKDNWATTLSEAELRAYYQRNLHHFSEQAPIRGRLSFWQNGMESWSREVDISAETVRMVTEQYPELDTLLPTIGVGTSESWQKDGGIYQFLCIERQEGLPLPFQEVVEAVASQLVEEKLNDWLDKKTRRINMMILRKKLLPTFVYSVLSALGSALVMKANPGQGSFMALQVALAAWLGLDVGTVYIALSVGLFLVCLVLDKRHDYLQYVYMLLAIVLFGWLTNLFVYHVLASFVLPNYLTRLIVFLVGLTLMGATLGKLLDYNIVRFPLEKVCLLAEERTSWSFRRYRYGMDILFVSSALGISLLGTGISSIREGTILTMLILPGIISMAKSS